MKPSYHTIEELLDMVDEPFRVGCIRLYLENRRRFEVAWGATHNHQAWPGGYHDHVCEAMNLGVQIYMVLRACRPLPFTLSDALICLFIHDAEKAWKYDLDGNRIEAPHLKAKPDRQAFRMELAARYNIPITEEQIRGIKYAEGEPDDEYSPKHRVMTPLAALVHACDNLSARCWFDFPLAESDPWVGARRCRPMGAV